MKSIIFAILLCLSCVFLFFKDWLIKEPQLKMYNRNGIINHEIRLWIDTITVTSGNSFSVDISSAGFTGITGVSAGAMKNTSTLSSIPMCQIKSISTTAVVFNMVEENSTTINILGSLVLLGTPLQFVSSTNGLQVAVAVLGY